MKLRLSIDLNLNKPVDDVDEQLQRDIKSETDALIELIKADLETNPNSLLKLSDVIVRAVPHSEIVSGRSA